MYCLSMLNSMLVVPTSPTFFVGYLWRCATVVLQYLENHNNFPKGCYLPLPHHALAYYPCADYFVGKKVIELGAGTGLVGIAMAKLGVLAGVSARPFNHVFKHQVRIQSLLILIVCWG